MESKKENMDIKLAKKKGLKALLRVRNLPYLLVLILIVFIVWLFMRDNSSTMNIDARTISIAKITKGEFNDYISVSGQVLPFTTIQLSPLEGGIVQRILVEEGTMIKRGDVLFELKNDNLTLAILNSKADYEGKKSALLNTMSRMEKDRINLRQEQLRLNLDITRKKRTYDQNGSLYEEQLIAKEVWLQSKEDYELSELSRNLVLERQKQDSISQAIEIVQLKNNLNNTLINFNLIRDRELNLSVRSSIDGELGMFDITIGQSIGAGTKIGQINDLSKYKIEASIDEHYIDRVRSGLNATFDRQNTTFATSLRRVYPEVRRGSFRADFEFQGERPDNIRSGQTYYLDLQLGAPKKAILIPKGSFYQSTGGNWIYVVDASGARAYKREIRIGRHNPQYYEVLEGLDVGETVIISNYNNYGENEVLILNKD